MKEQPNYFAIIPAKVRYDTNLKDKSKLLYGEIVALSNKEGVCWASNDYFASLYHTTSGNISKLISELVNNGYIERRIIYKEGTKEIQARYLQIEPYLWSNLTIPMVENDKDNNTSINNNYISIEKPKSKFVKPSVEEIDNYIKEKNLSVVAQEFYDYFEAGNWVDSKGNTVKNWKQKLLTWNKYDFSKKQTKQKHEDYSGYTNEVLNSLYEN